jgi:lipopolysaccharide/colanic/teichoic acid biosynthesis glycosyltransferase
VRPWEATLKRSLDVIVSAISLVVLGPLLLTIALLVRLTSSGEVFFTQARLGKGGVPFEIYKFRTMLKDAPDRRNPDGSTFTGESDPRVTRVGRFLRKTSLDELPQLYNVLRGEMSLVGPRPDKVDQMSYYTPEEAHKLLVKPGITGQAQISGRNGIPWAERKRLDVEYVRRQSFWLDLRILMLTIPYVLAQREVVVERPSKVDSIK